MLSTTLLLSVVVVAGFSSRVYAAGGNNNGGVPVTGTTPACATTTINNIQPLVAFTQIDSNGGHYNIPTVTFKGNLTNCSTSAQAYFIEVTDDAAGAQNIFGTTECISGGTAGDFIMKAGDKKGWSSSMNMTPVGVTDLTGCVGTHNITVTVHDRSVAGSPVIYTTTSSFTVLVNN